MPTLTSRIEAESKSNRSPIAIVIAALALPELAQKQSEFLQLNCLGTYTPLNAIILVVICPIAVA